jgi:probable HAF family extracellular repeat protein
MKQIESQIETTFARWCVRLGLAACLIFARATTATAQPYAVTDLGALGGTNGMAYGINDQEQIVGTAQTAMGSYHAFMFDGGRMIDLGTMGGSNSWAYGINNMGWMVGAAQMPMTNMHAFLCTNALLNPMMMDIGTLGGSNSAAWMIDMHGDMVGWTAMTNGSHHAFFMTNSTMGDMMDLGTAGGMNSEAYCINSNRTVVGYTMMSNGTMVPIMSTNALYGSSSMMTMGMGGMGGASGGQSWSVNNMGQEAGQAEMAGGNFHAFASGSSGMMGGRTTVDLGTLGGTNSFAYGMNDGGTVVGTAQMMGGTYHAFMVTNALGGMVRMMDLNTLIPTNSGWELMEARGMNAAGQIIGWGMHAGHTNAFLLTPVSGPTMMTAAPGTEIIGPGTMLSLQMQMNATDPLTYQWLHDGVPRPGRNECHAHNSRNGYGECRKLHGHGTK